MSADCNPFAIPHSLFMSVMCVYVFLFSCLYTVSPRLYVAHFIASPLLLSVRLSVSPYPFLPFTPFFFFSLHSVFLSSPTLHSPGTRLSFSTAVTTVFSSIYSGATRLLKAEWLPWALLFACDFLPLTIFKCN